MHHTKPNLTHFYIWLFVLLLWRSLSSIYTLDIILWCMICKYLLPTVSCHFMLLFLLLYRSFIWCTGEGVKDFLTIDLFIFCLISKLAKAIFTPLGQAGLSPAFTETVVWDLVSHCGSCPPPALFTSAWALIPQPLSDPTTWPSCTSSDPLPSEAVPYLCACKGMHSIRPLLLFLSQLWRKWGLQSFWFLWSLVQLPSHSP